jgi:hypothetical protein
MLVAEWWTAAHGLRRIERSTDRDSPQPTSLDDEMPDSYEGWAPSLLHLGSGTLR